MADLTILAEVLELFPEGSPQHAALAKVIADSRRLDKAERLKIDISEGPDSTFWAITADGIEGSGPTIRAAIDGVPE